MPINVSIAATNIYTNGLISIEHHYMVLTLFFCLMVSFITIQSA